MNNSVFCIGGFSQFFLSIFTYKKILTKDFQNLSSSHERSSKDFPKPLYFKFMKYFFHVYNLTYGQFGQICNQAGQSWKNSKCLSPVIGFPMKNKYSILNSINFLCYLVRY